MPPLFIYVTGFRQHAGKTVTSLGLLSLLKQIYDPTELGYIKPVGQEMVKGPDGSLYDKDAAVIQRFGGIPDIDPQDISPVRLTSGFTKEFMESKDPLSITLSLANDIERAVQTMKNKKVIVAEGTGHPGVGGIVGLSNAEVSNRLKAETVFLSGGGIGKALDQLEVDLSYFIYKKSNVRGVIFNKIIPEKMDQTKKFLTEDYLNRMYGKFENPLRIFGYLPTVEDLDKPSMQIIHEAFKQGEALGDRETAKWTRPTNQVKIITLPEEYLNLNSYLHPADILILGAGSKNRMKMIIDYHKAQPPGQGIGGIILTCGRVTDLLDESRRELEDTGIPGLYVQEDTAEAENVVRNCFENTKLQVFDAGKALEIESLFQKYFDWDKFKKTLGLRKS
ncbi:MAG: hypothetical protein A2Z96_01570 [Spirochaetes bacterium GWB1_48_6]|nr:MAG: hypothetical protein A2Z96_01570 [Spirochaetes bacterium GWB1_48_6]